MDKNSAKGYSERTVLTSSSIRLLVADDHALIRAGLSAILQQQPGWDVVAEAKNGQQAVDLYCQHRPDVVLMDLYMSGFNGLQATKAIRQEFPQVRIILLTISDREEDMVRAVQVGAKAYLLKDADKTMRLEAIRQVVSETYIPTAVARKLPNISIMSL